MNLYANIDCAGNVLSVAWYKTAPEGAVLVTELPIPSDGSEFQCSKFKIIDGEWVEMSMDHQSPVEFKSAPSMEDRLAALESALLELILGGSV